MKNRDTVTPQIDQELRQLKESNAMVPLSEIGNVVRAVVKALPWDKMIQTHKNAQLQSNSASVQKAVEDLDMMAVRDFVLPSIERELAAIVESLHTATSRILESVEKLEIETETPNNIEIKMAITHIYEACGFQDITGQRMSKIIQLLKKMEVRIEGLLGRAGDLAAAERYSKMLANQKENETETETLMGPNAGTLASSQADIDRLFSDSNK